MLLTPEWYDRLLAAQPPERQKGYEVFVAAKELLQTIVGFHLHQGIMAIARIPARQSLEEVFPTIPSPLLLVALDGLNHAENVGVIVRNCAAFGVDALIVGESSCSPYLRRAVRNSMGTIFSLPVVHVEHLGPTLAQVRERYGTSLLATDPNSTSALSGVDLTCNICMIFGNEDAGISEDILALSDHRVAIPMHGGTDSLNVASASAVCLYEVSKQRQRDSAAPQKGATAGTTNFTE